MQARVLFQVWNGGKVDFIAQRVNSIFSVFAFISKSSIFMTGLSLISCLSGYCRGGDKPEHFEKFLSTHCYECHGSKEQEGEIRLDNLELDLTNQENIEIWQVVLDQLNLNGKVLI